MRLSDEIIDRLRRFVISTRSDVVLPNYFHGIYEMDLFKLNDRGYVSEYEIKISRADYLNDFKKGSKHYNLQYGKLITNRFFFVVPKDLIKVEEVPKYCGLIYYTRYGDHGSFCIVKNAPLLHKGRFTDYKTLAHKMSFINSNLRFQLNRYKKGCPKCEDSKQIIADLKNDARVAKDNLTFYLKHQPFNTPTHDR